MSQSVIKHATTFIHDPQNPHQKLMLKVEYGIRKEHEDQEAHIFVEAEAYPILATGRPASRPIRYGSLWEEIRIGFPWLSLLLELNLCSVETGAHITAVETAWFYLNGTVHADENSLSSLVSERTYSDAASFLRTTPEILKDIQTKDQLRELIEFRLKPLWQLQVASTLVALGFYEYSDIHHCDNLQILFNVGTDDPYVSDSQTLSEINHRGILSDEYAMTYPIIGFRIG